MSAYIPVSTNKKHHTRRNRSGANSANNSEDELVDEEEYVMNEESTTIHTASILTSSINISNTILGTGMLAMVTYNSFHLDFI